NLFLLLFSFVEIFLHLLINVETLASFLIVILPLKITFLMSVAHPSITFVNFAKFVLLLTQIPLSCLLTLLCLQNLTIATLFSTIFLIDFKLFKTHWFALLSHLFVVIFIF